MAGREAKGTLAIGEDYDAQLEPCQGATGGQTVLSDTVFSTVPGPRAAGIRAQRAPWPALRGLLPGADAADVGARRRQPRWMLALAVLMAIEKNVPWGRRLSAPLCAALLAGAATTVATHV